MTAVLDRVAPLSFVCSHRLDLVVKWRLFLHLQDRTDPEAVRLYLWHIETRTGGYEVGGEKTSLAAYLAAARALHISMKAHGFDPRHPVRVGSNGRLMDGAHRIACALALRLREIPVRRLEVAGRARAWDAAFMRGRGIGPEDLAHIERDVRALMETGA